ncbi:MAG: hypothetical protein AAB312_03985 [Pseudomonadota bacterium]
MVSETSWIPAFAGMTKPDVSVHFSTALLEHDMVLVLVGRKNCSCVFRTSAIHGGRRAGDFRRATLQNLQLWETVKD